MRFTNYFKFARAHCTIIIPMLFIVSIMEEGKTALIIFACNFSNNLIETYSIFHSIVIIQHLFDGLYFVIAALYTRIKL